MTSGLSKDHTVSCMITLFLSLQITMSHQPTSSVGQWLQMATIFLRGFVGISALWSEGAKSTECSREFPYQGAIAVPSNNIEDYNNTFTLFYVHQQGKKSISENNDTIGQIPDYSNVTSHKSGDKFNAMTFISTNYWCKNMKLFCSAQSKLS